MQFCRKGSIASSSAAKKVHQLTTKKKLLFSKPGTLLINLTFYATGASVGNSVAFRDFK